jgi:hypothetical protein
MDVLYRPGKLHIVPDALLRLETITIPEQELRTNQLDDIPAIYHAILVEISEECKANLMQAYQTIRYGKGCSR